MNKLILFEGVDAVGKTTLAKILSKRLGAFYIKNPPLELEPMRREIDEKSPEERTRFFLKGNEITSKLAEENLKQSTVVMDRYFYSSLAFYLSATGEGLYFENNLIKPDLIILLTCDLDESERRLKSRSNLFKHENIDFIKIEAKSFEKILLKLSNVIRLDTTSKDPELLVDELIKLIN